MLRGGVNWICPELKVGGSADLQMVPPPGHVNGTATAVAVLTAVNVEVGCLVGGTLVSVGALTLVSVGCTVFTGMLVGLLGLGGLGFRMGVLSSVVAVECAIGNRVGCGSAVAVPLVEMCLVGLG